MRGLGAVVIGLLMAGGCAARVDGPPEIVVDRTACSHCGMLISEPAFAAAYQAPPAEGRVFDDIGCLLAAARREQAPGLRFWFHDAGTGTWIDGEKALFVVSRSIRTPMSGGIIAYGDLGAAEDAAAKHGGELVRSLPALLARSGGEER
jgi:copper chaperone NosL